MLACNLQGTELPWIRLDAKLILGLKKAQRHLKQSGLLRVGEGG